VLIGTVAKRRVTRVLPRSRVALAQRLDRKLDRTRATAVALAGERPAGRMTRLGSLWSYGIPYATLDEEMQRIDKVTLDDLRKSLRDFPLQPVVTGLLHS
jgi:predicted Zn-dependent peptidase